MRKPSRRPKSRSRRLPPFLDQLTLLGLKLRKRLCITCDFCFTDPRNELGALESVAPPLDEFDEARNAFLRGLRRFVLETREQATVHGVLDLRQHVGNLHGSAFSRAALENIDHAPDTRVADAVDREIPDEFRAPCRLKIMKERAQKSHLGVLREILCGRLSCHDVRSAETAELFEGNPRPVGECLAHLKTSHRIGASSNDLQCLQKVAPPFLAGRSH